MKYIFGFAALLGVFAAAGYFGIQVGVGIGAIAVLVAMMVSSRFK